MAKKTVSKKTVLKKKASKKKASKKHRVFTTGPSGWKFAQSGLQDYSDEDWDDPTLISQGGASPTVVLGRHDESSVLIAKNFNFSVGGIVNGIEVKFTASSTGTHLVCHCIELTKTGDNVHAAGCVDHSINDPIGAATTVTKGTGSDLWGCLGWSASEINSPDFGVLLRFENYNGTADETLTLTEVQVQVTSTTP